MSVGRMLAEMPSSELAEWMAFDSLEPFGDQRADLRAGIIASATVNSGMSRPKKPTRPIDFMPFIDDKSSAPVLLKDPVQQGKLIAESLFGGMNVKKVH